MSDIKHRDQKRTARHLRVRKRVRGTTERPRLSVFKSSKHVYAQVIDDVSGVTLVSCCTLTPALREEVRKVKPVERAKRIGSAVAEMAKEKGITTVVFDRGGYPYMGRIKALADAAREKGLRF